MKLILKTIKQEIYEIDLSGDDITVAKLKELIEDYFGYDQSKIKLLFNSVVLDNNKKLSDYNIEHGFTLVMANLKKKDSQSHIKNNNTILNLNETGDLNLYSNDTNIDQTNSEVKQQFFEADIKAANAVNYVASIMKVLYLQNPEKGKEFMKNFEEDNPQVWQLIKMNDAEFKRLLYSPKTEEDERIFNSFSKGELKETSQSTKEVDPDEENILKLTEYGFSYDSARDAYHSCEKKFELALHFLLENNQ